MYEEFFGLEERPFRLTPNPRYVFYSDRYRNALEQLRYGVENREGFLLLTGLVGTGKTTLSRDLLENLDDGRHRTALIFNPFLDPREMLQALLSEFGCSYPRDATKKELLDRLNTFLLAQLVHGQTCVALFDEAQHLSEEFLEQVRVLSNLETEHEKLLQIVLVGQPELRERIQRPSLAQLDQRVAVRCTLSTLSEEETERYLYHRVNVAGGRGGVTFDRRAIRLIHRESEGVPRLVNLAADRALLAAYVDRSTTVKRSHVKKGLESLRGEEREAAPAEIGEGRRGERGWVVALVVAAVIVLAVAAYLYLGGQPCLIADALKRAQEQRTGGPGEDRARRMLRAPGPLRVDAADSAAMTKPLAFAVAAVVVAALLLAGSIVLAPGVEPVAMRLQAGSSTGEALPGSAVAGMGEEMAINRPEGIPDGIAGQVLDARGVSPERIAGGQEGVEAFGAVERTGAGGPGTDAGLGSGAGPEPGPGPSGSAVATAPEPVAERDSPPLGGASGAVAGAERGRGTFRISVRGGAEERTAEDHVVAALSAHRAGELARAASLYRSALELRPGDAELWNNLGTVYRGLSMPEEALVALRAAVEAEPSYAPGWSNLGVVLDGLGREGEAMEAFREALRRDPGNLGAKVNLANKYHSLGMRGDARRLLTEVLRADPALPEAHYGLARVQEEEGEIEEAVRHYELFLELGSGRFPALEKRVAEHLVGLSGGGP